MEEAGAVGGGRAVQTVRTGARAHGGRRAAGVSDEGAGCHDTSPVAQAVGQGQGGRQRAFLHPHRLVVVRVCVQSLNVVGRTGGGTFEGCNGMDETAQKFALAHVSSSVCMFAIIHSG